MFKTENQIYRENLEHLRKQQEERRKALQPRIFKNEFKPRIVKNEFKPHFLSEIEIAEMNMCRW